MSSGKVKPYRAQSFIARAAGVTLFGSGVATV
jgi:hypothetical protein